MDRLGAACSQRSARPSCARLQGSRTRAGLARPGRCPRGPAQAVRKRRGKARPRRRARGSPLRPERLAPRRSGAAPGQAGPVGRGDRRGPQRSCREPASGPRNRPGAGGPGPSGSRQGSASSGPPRRGTENRDPFDRGASRHRCDPCAHRARAQRKRSPSTWQGCRQSHDERTLDRFGQDQFKSEEVLPRHLRRSRLHHLRRHPRQLVTEPRERARGHRLDEPVHQNTL